MTSNWLDRAIGVVSPQRQLRRTHARLALERIERLTNQNKRRHTESLRYDGARSGRRTDGWQAGASDATVELQHALVLLRDRSRDLIRNNPYAVKAIEELVGNTVGTGITPQANTGNEDLDKLIDAEWPYFSDNCDTPQRLDFYGMQALVTRTMAESGESVLRYRPRLPSDNLRIPLQLQLLEADFLDHSRTMGTVNGHVMQGVEFDLLGRRVAYWLFTQHPGGVLILNPRGGIISQRIPADQVLHIYRVLRPGQVRGVPWLAPVMIGLRDLADYLEAEQVRKKTEACIGMVVTQPNAEPQVGVTHTDPTTGQLIEELAPGMVVYTREGEDVKFLTPTAMGGFRDYKTSALQEIASGTSVPYENLASDMSLVNYSSFKAGNLGFRNTVDGYRWLTLLPLFAQPVRKRFIDILVLQGKIPAKAQQDDSINLYGTDWTAPKWESVDPLKDARAQIEKIRSGTLTLFEAISENGGDPRRQLALIAKANKLIDKLGLVLDSDPRYTSLRGLAQPTQVDQTPKEPGKNAPSPKPSSSNAASEIEDELAELFASHARENGAGGRRHYS